MRAALLLGLLVAACTPEIQSGVYFCGPGASCPDGFACDGATNTCVTPTEVTAFSCSEGDPLVAPTCAPSTTGSSGCVDTANASDTWTIQAQGCPMHWEVMISYPEAFMPLQARVIEDDIGKGTTQPCHEVHAGLQDACLEFDGQPAPTGSTYTIEVSAAAGGDTCNGACAYNRYQLAVQVTPP